MFFTKLLSGLFLVLLITKLLKFIHISIFNNQNYKIKR